MKNFMISIILGAILTFVLVKLVNNGYISWDKIIIASVFLLTLLFLVVFFFEKRK